MRHPSARANVALRTRTGWIGRYYGRKQGLVRCLYHGLLDRSGRYARLGRIDWGRIERLVFVCQGNICRSAYAEARARAMGVEALSFGLGTQGGDESPPLMRRLAADAGLDLAAHRYRPPPRPRAWSARTWCWRWSRPTWRGSVARCRRACR